MYVSVGMIKTVAHMSDTDGFDLRVVDWRGVAGSVAWGGVDVIGVEWGEVEWM